MTDVSVFFYKLFGSGRRIGNECITTGLVLKFADIEIVHKTDDERREVFSKE